jgi:phage FluMu gp28-like protein
MKPLPYQDQSGGENAGGADIAPAAMSAASQTAHIPQSETVDAPPEGDRRSQIAATANAQPKVGATKAGGGEDTAATVKAEGHDFSRAEKQRSPNSAGASAPEGGMEKAEGRRQSRKNAATVMRGTGGGEDTAATGTVNLLPYQRRWVEDSSPLKIVVKARQIGYSFAATLRAVLSCLERKTTWIFLSKGERQSRLLMEKVQDHIRSCGVVARAVESAFFEGTAIKQLEARFPNGSVIYGLPANPDTARGYSGNVTLDEFAFHADAEKIYAALFPSITRGYSLEIISTPNGQQGKFYELAKAAGLVDKVTGYREQVTGRMQARAGLTPVTCNLSPITWSPHSCDIYEAVRQGLKIDLRLLRAGCDDETAWQQEYCCQFVSTTENFFPPDLLAACLSAEASTDTPLSQLLTSAPAALGSSPQSAEGSGQSEVEYYLGIDIGRQHDRTVFWLDQVEPAKLENRNSKIGALAPRRESSDTNFEGARVSIARLVETLDRAPFEQQLARARQLLSLTGADGEPLVRRAAIDSTGMGAPLAESLQREFGPRVEPVTFTAAMKENLAYRTKRRMENRLSLLPDTREIRQAFSAVKRFVTPSGNLRFDAARTEAGHADEFWAKALADFAADQSRGRPARLEDVFLAEGAPIISPAAFLELGAGWMELARL